MFDNFKDLKFKKRRGNKRKIKNFLENLYRLFASDHEHGPVAYTLRAIGDPL